MIEVVKYAMHSAERIYQAVVVVVLVLVLVLEVSGREGASDDSMCR